LAGFAIANRERAKFNTLATNMLYLIPALQRQSAKKILVALHGHRKGKGTGFGVYVTVRINPRPKLDWWWPLQAHTLSVDAEMHCFYALSTTDPQWIMPE